ncbi:MAG TPA: hypothetical protein VMV01_13245 [Planctomycetota bacterium]|jgi:hypothetical protein|nr:hypothetical protein [Planctomycetota bacterium]HZJ72198.1 hypothetical protein [Planctomycetota bacterium]
MTSLLHEHWKWIVGSIVLVVAAIVLIMLLGDEDMSPFQYSQF